MFAAACVTSAALRPGQTEVQNQQIIGRRTQCRAHRLTTSQPVDSILLQTQRRLQGLPQLWIIFYQQDTQGHLLPRIIRSSLYPDRAR